MPQSSRPLRVLAASLALSLIGILTACGFDTPAPGAGSSTQDGTADPPAAAPSAEPSESVPIPAGDPLRIEGGWVISSFPVPAGAQVDINQPTGPDDDDLVITFKSGDTDTILTFYSGALKAEGYEVVGPIPTLGLQFTGKGVSGNVIDTEPVSIVIIKD